MVTLSIIFYMLAGTQIGGRVFFWATEGKNDMASCIFCLGIIPLLWPVFILLAFFPKTAHFKTAIWRWYDREVP